MIKFDYHTHSLHSTDGTASMEDMINAAISLGLEEYAITDHLDFDWPNAEIINCPYGIAANIKAMEAMKKKFEGKIKVLAGAEISLRPDVAHIAQEIADAHDFDFIIGSAHDFEGIDFGLPQLHRGRSQHEVYTAYFENLLDVVRTCDAYDVVGHFDYVVRYGNYSDKSLRYADHKEIIDTILKIIISKGKGIEINTAGIPYGIGHPHPHIDILRQYIKLGGEIITAGSDAHRPGNIAQYFDTAYEILQQLGVKYITRFDKRKPTFSAL